MSDSDQAVAAVLKNEGSAYREDDYGRGPSKYGITLKTYKQIMPNATATDIANLTAEAAAACYRAHFWYKYNIYNIGDQALANKVLDLAVLDGPGTAIIWLQHAVGAEPDGILGPDTLKKLRSIQNQAGVLQNIRSLAEVHYRQVVAEHPEKQKELAGWLARLAK